MSGSRMIRWSKKDTPSGTRPFSYVTVSLDPEIRFVFNIYDYHLSNIGSTAGAMENTDPGQGILSQRRAPRVRGVYTRITASQTYGKPGATYFTRFPISS